MFKNKIASLVIGGAMALVGLVAGIATMAGAQGASAMDTITQPANTAVANTTPAVDTPEPGDVPDTASPKIHGHAPLGGDGIVSSVNGTTIVMGEESDEGGSSYTIDASNAAITNNGVAGTLSDIKAGEKIFVQGTTTGTNVVATSISVGREGEHGDKANDADGGATSEASEPAGSAGFGE